MSKYEAICKYEESYVNPFRVYRLVESYCLKAFELCLWGDQKLLHWEEQNDNDQRHEESPIQLNKQPQKLRILTRDDEAIIVKNEGARFVLTVVPQEMR